MSKKYLPLFVLIGAVAGVTIGLLSPEFADVISPLGQIYIRLMEVVVLPYIIASLVLGLGRLTPTLSWRLFQKSWAIYVLLWLFIFVVLVAISGTVPLVGQSVVVDFSGAGAATDNRSVIDLLIPDNFFAALNQNYIPAVVLMAIIYGVSVQNIDKRGAFLDVLALIRTASVTIWGWVVLIAPFGICALFAETLSSVSSAGIAAMSLYIVVVVLSALLIALWILPMTLTAFLPMRYWEILSSLKDAFLISIFTSLSVAALPMIQTAAENFANKYARSDSATERKEIIQTTLSISYPLAQIGNFFILVFIVYASFYYFVPISFANLIELPVVTLLSGIGSPTSSIGAVNFVSEWLGMPAETTDLYVETMSITRYVQVLASVSAFAFVTFLVTFVFYGKIKFDKRRFALTAFVSLVCVSGIFVVGRSSGSQIHLHSITNYLALGLPAELQAFSDANQTSKLGTGPATSNDDGTPNSPAPPAKANDQSTEQPGSTLRRIQASGVMRVGINTHVMPFTYENGAGRLVGYDVEMIYRFAESMNVEITFISYAFQNLIDNLKSNDFDIAIGGLYVTDERLQEVTVSDRYYVSPLALIVKTDRIDDFASLESMNAVEDLDIGVFDDPILVPLARQHFPSAKVTVLPNYEDSKSFESIDGAIWTLEQARAWAISHPGYSAVVPEDVSGRFLFGYLMPPGSEELAGYLNYWLRLQETNGILADMTRRWIDPNSNDGTEGSLPPAQN